MIEKPKRPKKIPNQDNKQPQTIQELIRRYDLDNTKIYDYLDALVLQINKQHKQDLELIFPTGSSYITQEDVNPSTILGFGTWERLKGKVSIGLDESDENFNEIGKTGGETVHTLTEEEIPEHKHHTARGGPIGNSNLDAEHQIAMYATSEESDLPYSLRNGDPSVGVLGATTSSGQGKAHNNLQPYEVVGYMWIRRA